MNKNITVKGMDTTESIKNRIDESIEKIEKFSLPISSLNVVVVSSKTGIKVEFEVVISKSSPVIVTQENKDFFVAIDLLEDRLKKALRRLHDKKVQKRRKRGLKYED